MTTQQLTNLFKQVQNDMDNLNIPYCKVFKVKINTRAVRRRGACKKTKKGFVIELTDFILFKTDEEIKDVIAHELIHTCEGCFNHGSQFKMYADKINTLGYNVKATYSGEAPEIEQFAKYKIVCKECGNTIYRMKMSKVIRNISKYKCAKCGGKLDIYVRKNAD